MKFEEPYFKEYMKSKTKAKLRFFPVINNQEFDITTGDFHKYVVTSNNTEVINRGITGYKNQ